VKSQVVASFWACYAGLDAATRTSARKAYRLWARNPFHPSLRFKCINRPEGIWAVRISLGVHALGVMDGDTITWFWVGSHGDYERFFG